MKKQLLFLAALFCAAVLNAKNVNLNPGPWEVDGAKYAVWHWQDGGSDGSFSAFMTNSGTTYSTNIDDNSNKLIFVRINGEASSPNWEQKWNQTANLDYCEGTYTITGWDEAQGSWDCTGGGGGGSSACGDDYYLTGDGTWTGGEAWSATAAKLTNGKIVIPALAAGTYSFKITQGCWSNNWGASAINTSCSNLTCTEDTDGNAVFTLSATADVTFTFDGVSICLSTDSDVPTPTPVTLKTFDTPTPANCGDVMLQAFYYDSNEDKGYGNTQWSTLLKAAGETGAYFDMIWLPPSAYSSGGIGYIPRQFCNQNSYMGAETDLKKLIEIYHDNDAKVIADIVINHHGNKSSWCDFFPEDFGTFGSFQLTAAQICKDDKVNTTSDTSVGDCKGKATGANDTGEKDGDYTDARNLDHTSAYVQRFCKAYLKWMMNVMDYDGFRYDVAKGFAPTYFGQYNSDAKPYFSVGEYFDSNYDRLKNWVDGTGKKSAVFDFAIKFNCFNQAWKDGASPDYSKLVYNGQPAGFIGAEYRQYAVTFIDNHDTFERSDNKDNEFLGYKKSMTAANKANVLQANAWLLSMPGVPCVFYPHYYKYKTEIQAMIRARKTAGVTNTSSVTINTCESGKLMATVKGTKGDLILKLGSDLSTPSGYKSIASGSGYAMFVPSSLTEETPKAKPQLTVSPEGGKYLEAQKVTMTCSVSGAKIYYTLDGTEPTTSSNVYSSAITISEATTLKAYAATSDGDTKVQTHEYSFVDPNVPITVKLYKPAAWTDVKLWAWNADGNFFTKWPGQVINDDGDGWWSYTFDLAAKRPVNIIFTTGSGGDQTQDITGVMESTCYYINSTTGMAKVSPDCQTISAVKDIPVVAVTIYPNPVHDILNIQTEARIESAQVYSLTGQCQLTENGDIRQLQVNGMNSGMYILRLITTDGKQTTRLFVKE